MKLLPLTLAGLLPLACPFRAAAQAPEAAVPAKPRQALKLGLFSSETAGGSYERQLGPRTSLQATLGYWTFGRRGARSFAWDSASFTPVWQDQYQYRVHRAALAVQVRRYLQARKPALVGWYAGAGAQLRGYWTRYRYDDGRTERGFAHDQTLQLRLGRQCQLGPRFTIDVGLGPELAVGTERHWRYDPTSDQFIRGADRYFYARPAFGLDLQVGYRL